MRALRWITVVVGVAISAVGCAPTGATPQTATTATVAPPEVNRYPQYVEPGSVAKAIEMIEQDVQFEGMILPKRLVCAGHRHIDTMRFANATAWDADGCIHVFYKNSKPIGAWIIKKDRQRSDFWRVYDAQAMHEYIDAVVAKPFR